MRKPIISILVAIIVIVLVVVVFGTRLVFNYTLPVYHYESSDRGMAEIEIPWKGRKLDIVEERFEKYKKWKNDPNIKLCRTSKRIWSAPNLWWDNLTNRRWYLPYITPSHNPKTDYSWNMSRINE